MIYIPFACRYTKDRITEASVRNALPIIVESCEGYVQNITKRLSIGYRYAKYLVIAVECFCRRSKNMARRARQKHNT